MRCVGNFSFTLRIFFLLIETQALKMIDVTVKTLDSQNRRYSVPDDVSTLHVVLYLRVYLEDIVGVENLKSSKSFKEIDAWRF